MNGIRIDRKRASCVTSIRLLGRGEDGHINPEDIGPVNDRVNARVRHTPTPLRPSRVAITAVRKLEQRKKTKNGLENGSDSVL